MSQYLLSSSLHSHSQDVRSLKSTPSSAIISGSRDSTAIVWKPSLDGKAGYAAEKTIKNPDGKFVSSVGWLEVDGRSYIVLGSQSSTIHLYSSDDPSAPGPAYTLVGHSSNVVCLDSFAGTLISGSWDKSAIVWKDFKQVIKLDKHEQAVWSVRCVGEDRFLTASADKTIKLFSLTGSILQTFTGHTDCVRSLSLRTDGVEGFWSAGNDSNVFLWEMSNSKPIQKMQGHLSFVYEVVALANGEGAISSGEDGCLRVWKDGQAIQSIFHPTTSVWCLCLLPNGDIASGSSDGLIRIWTKDTARIASQEEMKELEGAVAKRQINKTQIGDVNKVDLPGMDALKRPGKQDGQVIMVKHGEAIEAYQWQASQKTWQQMGEVVDAVGSNRKQLFEGKEYDYVFEVDIAEGQPPLKLPYNANENPWSAAERWLNRHELPLTFADQVVAFIEKNTAGVQLGTAAYSDPYTGGSRYQSTAPTGATGQAYRDPLTGGNAYSSVPSTSKDPSKSILPVKTPLLFKQLNVAAVKKKIGELNTTIKNDPLMCSQALLASEERNLDEVFAQLGAPAVAQPDVNAVAPAERYDAATFVETMSKWPEDMRFPIVDICRALCVSSPAIANCVSPIGNIIQVLLLACSWQDQWVASKPRETNTMIAMRGIANLAGTRNGKAMLGSTEIGELLSDLASRHPFDGFNKTIRVALATIGLNCSILAVDGRYPVSQARALLQFISNILTSEMEDAEVAYRTIVALGNMLSAPQISGSLPAGDVEVAKELAQGLADRLGESRLKEMMVEVQSI